MNRACEAVGLNRASAYRHIFPKFGPKEPVSRPSPKRRIPDEERDRIREVLDSPRFIDQPPREVYAILLGEGKHLCSWSTMYRLINECGPIKERRNQREAKVHAIPRLCASAPNQIWTWDISKLRMLTTGIFLNLYVILDLYSRYVVAWMVAAHENSALAQQLFAEAIERYQIDPNKLIVHQDRGAPMTSHAFAGLLSSLGVDQSFSRPRVSNDNAFSESLFRTAKYQPDYPGRFADLQEGREWCGEFFRWYNDSHHHTGLALFTPADVFHGRVDDVTAIRAGALEAAYRAHPERFVNGPPRVRQPPVRVMINPLDSTTTVEEILSARPEELDAQWAPTLQVSTQPVINVPGAAKRPSGCESSPPLH